MTLAQEDREARRLLRADREELELNEAALPARAVSPYRRPGRGVEARPDVDGDAPVRAGVTEIPDHGFTFGPVRPFVRKPRR